MSFTNINDPAGVSALLEQLRSSQAWTDLQAQQIAPASGQPVPKSEPPSQSPPLEDAADASKNVSQPSVASLLSQLGSASASRASSAQGTSISSLPSSSSMSAPSPEPSTKSVKDVRNSTFQQALPHLAQLSDDPKFIDAVLKVRRDQNTLEKQLWDERQALHAKQAEKVKIAVTKAIMLGTGISEREANAMKQVFENELNKFDRERVMPAWEGLIARQQAALEKMGVPAMFVTSEKPDMERQQRIVQVLEGIVGPSQGTS
ncbi:hypothetical protein ACEPAI_5761 [Sanghuangporus weigelae]